VLGRADLVLPRAVRLEEAIHEVVVVGFSHRADGIGDLARQAHREVEQACLSIPGPAQHAHTIAPANRSDTPRGRGLSRHGPAANAQARRYLSQRRRPLPADPIALALSGDLGVAVDRSLALEALRGLEAARAELELERRRIAAVRRRLKGGR